MEEGLRGNEAHWSKIKEVYERIKRLEIQGATNVAKAAISVLREIPKGMIDEAASYLQGARPTEPLMQNLLLLIISSPIDAKDEAISTALEYLEVAKRSASVEMAKILIEEGVEVAATICHSSTVTEALRIAKEKGALKEVIAFETRPKYQGRITARELSSYGINVEFYVDSAMYTALRKHKPQVVLFGNDAIFRDGRVVNKIGTNLLAHIARELGIDTYSTGVALKMVFADSIEIEERPADEVWEEKLPNVHINNPAFEIVEIDNLSYIVTEIGKYKPEEIAERIVEKYGWLENSFK